MADDPKKTGDDWKRIDMSEDRECRYWSKKFGVNPYELEEAGTSRWADGR
jgi:hypothetical protein